MAYNEDRFGMPIEEARAAGLPVDGIMQLEVIPPGRRNGLTMALLQIAISNAQSGERVVFFSRGPHGSSRSFDSAVRLLHHMGPKTRFFPRQAYHRIDFNVDSGTRVPMGSIEFLDINKNWENRLYEYIDTEPRYKSVIADFDDKGLVYRRVDSF